MLEIILATTNEGKLREVRALGEEFGVAITGMREKTAAMSIPEVPETGRTYEHNCREKAVAYQRIFECPVLADDSGIEVEALDGAPGVDSAVYAGIGKSSAEHIQKLWDELERRHVDKRAVKARMVSYVIHWDGKNEEHAFGTMDGRIIFEKRGNGGFGFDSIFIPEGETLTVSEIKDALPVGSKPYATHRAKAMKAMFEKLKSKKS